VPRSSPNPRSARLIRLKLILITPDAPPHISLSLVVKLCLCPMSPVDIHNILLTPCRTGISRRYITIMPSIENAESAKNQARLIGWSNQRHPFAASSNATSTTESRSNSAGTIENIISGVKNKALGGGRLGKGTRGWDGLPNNVLQ